VVALVLAGAGCGSSGPAPPPASSTTRSNTTSSSTAAPGTTTEPTAPATTTAGGVTPATIVRRGSDRKRWIALTFDGGSDAGNTAAILDLLAARHVHASFSFTGDFVRANPALVRRTARLGHVIVNHTDTHRSFTGVSTHTPPLSSAERIAELQRGDAAISAVTGASTRPWFRPPYGDIDAATAVDAARAGYRYELLWTVDSLGWQGLAPAAVVARCLDGATPGAILLLHVDSQSTDASALPAIISGLRAQGYELVTVATPGFVTG
jgi:peptidoglycan/xylan/chitin deacetylase (PgdA/CDA1 family)